MGPIKVDLPVLHALAQRRNQLSVSPKQRKKFSLVKRLFLESGISFWRGVVTPETGEGARDSG